MAESSNPIFPFRRSIDQYQTERMQTGIGGAPRKLLNGALPSLRVVALVYLGVSAAAALVFAITATVAPKAPVVQQVTEPARQAVTTLVQPTGEMIRSVMPAPAPTPADALVTHVVVPGTDSPPPFVGTATLYVSIDEVAPPPTEVIRVAQTSPPVALEVTSDEAPSDDQSEDVAPDEVAPAEEVIAPPADTQSVQTATVDAPTSLPTPAPTMAPETPQQAKARADAANQAAIDAAKAAATKARSDADAANQAAIDARRATAPKR
jgi:hypothetical protein